VIGAIPSIDRPFDDAHGATTKTTSTVLVLGWASFWPQATTPKASYIMVSSVNKPTFKPLAK